MGSSWPSISSTALRHSWAIYWRRAGDNSIMPTIYAARASSDSMRDACRDCRRGGNGPTAAGIATLTAPATAGNTIVPTVVSSVPPHHGTFGTNGDVETSVAAIEF